MKSKIYNHALDLFNSLNSKGLNLSFLDVLKYLYDSSVNRGNYYKANIINELINEELN
jgi:hypothetical protein